MNLLAPRFRETVRQFEPDGKPFEARGLNIYRLNDDRVVEPWIAVGPSTIRAHQAAQQALIGER